MGSDDAGRIPHLCGSGGGLHHVDDHHGDVVPAAGCICQADQFGSGFTGVGDPPEHCRHAVGADLVGQAVGAQQEPVAGHGAHHPGVNEYVGVKAERPGNDVALGMCGGLVGGELALAFHGGHEGMVLADLFEVGAFGPQQVGA